MAQNATDIEFAAGLPDRPDEHCVVMVAADTTSGPLDKVIALPYYIYKKYVSSQDAQQCSFHVTCANYTMLKVRRHGLLAGMIMGFDRLTRCHGRDVQHYLIHPETFRLIDEP